MERFNYDLTKQHFSVKIYRSYLTYIRKNYPNVNLALLCKEAGLSLEFIETSDSWVSVEFNYHFMNGIKKHINDDEFEMKVGLSSFNKEILGPVYFLAKNILSLEEIYNNIWRFPKFFNKVVTWEPIEKRTGYIKIKIIANTSSLNSDEKIFLIDTLPEIVQNSIGYYSGFSREKKLADSKITATRVSAEEYHLEIRYALERPKLIASTLMPAVLSGILGYLYFWYTQVTWQALTAGFVIFSINRLWKTNSRNKELLEAANQAEDTLNRLDVQYRTLIDTKMSLQRKLEESEAINTLTNSLIRTSSEDEILQSATENLTSILQFDRVLVMLHDEKNQFLTTRAHSAIDQQMEAVAKQFKLPITIESDDPTKVSNIYRSGKPVLIADVNRHISSLNSESKQLLKTTKSKSFIGVPIKSNSESHGVLLADTYLTDRILTKDDLSLLTLAGRQIAIAIEKQYAQNQAVEAYIELGTMAKSYSRFVPFEIIKLLGFKSVTDIKMEAGKETHMAIVFCDIRGFTTMAEKMTPTESMSFLNSYFSSLAPVFHRNGGLIDKFLGDGIMALFTNPQDAIQAASEFQSVLKEYNKIHAANGKQPEIRTGMGIHFGKVLLGAVGFEDRLSISVVSDAVNLTSRLDGLTKKFGIDIVCSGEAYMESTEKDNFRLIAELRVEGRNEPTKIFEYFGHLEEDVKVSKRETRTLLANLVSTGNTESIDPELRNKDSVFKFYLDKAS